MPFPSLEALAVRARQVLVRFPVTLAVGMAAAVLANIAFDREANEFWARLTLVTALGLPLSFALAVRAELRAWPRLVRVMAFLAGAGALAAFFIVWRGIDEKPDAIRFFQLAAALHLAVAFLPFAGMPETGAFWQYNRRLFLGFLRAVLFSGVLFAGLAVALVSLDRLFGLGVPGETYARLWFVLAFVVNTWIFLDGVPEHVLTLGAARSYPRALRAFTQYILTPLVAVYLLLLLAYLMKILVTGQWPSGWIGYLVASVSLAGLLGFLLVHPLRDDPGEGWIRTFGRLLFIGLIPGALMLLAALAKRIMPYGLTELRYLGALLGVWLLAISVLFTVRREHGIRVIPLSLCVLLLVTLFGPAGATHRAVASQSSRLRRELAVARAVPSPDRATPAEAQASAALEFLVERGASTEIARAFGGSVPGGVELASARGNKADSVARTIMTAASLDYVPPERASERERGYFQFNADARESLAITGFDWLVPLTMEDSIRVVGADTLRIAFDTTTARLTVATGRGAPLTFELAPVMAAFELPETLDRATSAVPVRRLKIQAAGTERPAALQLSWLSWRRESRQRRIEGWSGQLLLGAVAGRGEPGSQYRRQGGASPSSPGSSGFRR